MTYSQFLSYDTFRFLSIVKNLEIFRNGSSILNSFDLLFIPLSQSDTFFLKFFL